MSAGMDTDNNVIERAFRKRTYKSAFIYNKGYNGRRSCILRNISDTGALLEIEHIAGLPPHFTVGVELDAFEVNAKWIWRQEERVGVQFEGPFEPIETKRIQVLYLSDDPRLMEDQDQDSNNMQFTGFRGRSVQETRDRNSASRTTQRKSPGFGKR